MFLNKDTELSLSVVKRFQAFLFENYQYDFRDYAMSSFKRRVEHVLSCLKVNTVEDLMIKIQSDTTIIDQVVKEITVNTTEMFRDPSFWRKMRDEVIPHFSSSQSIRIWHAACSSGEEVYSMCILLKEMGLLDKAKIFASDLNSQVLNVAKTGVYPARSLDTTKSNFERFGGKTKLEDYYKLSYDNSSIKYDEQLIKNVSFKQHNLAMENDFSKFDIVLCRNVMIYFNFDLQDRVMQSLSNSLFKGGYLAVGSKETIAWCSAAKDFHPLSIEEKIYKKIV
jgi:chemotaxis protein methyltransferase CheR